MKSTKEPLISCICITGEKPLSLMRSIACFEQQEYVNKELIVSYPKGDTATRLVLEAAKAQYEIRLIALERGAEDTHGKAQNDAIRRTSGDFVCIWNDGDWYNTDRLSTQLKVIKSPFKASVITRIILYHFHKVKAFQSFFYRWESTLFCEKKTLLKYKYSEDVDADGSGVIHALSSSNQLYHLSYAPHTYIHIYNGHDISGQGTFETYMEHCKALSQEVSEQVKEFTRLDCYQ